jgi:hypothetical protein
MLTAGGGSIFRLAVAVLPLAAFADVTAPVVLTRFPPAVAVTLTINVHEALAATVPPERLTLFEPAAAVMVPPPHEPVSPLGVATTSPAGNVSVNATPVSAAVLPAGLVMVKLKVVVAFRPICDAPNDLLIEGGSITAMLAEALAPLPPSLEVTELVVLFCAPVAVLVTFTLKVHEELPVKLAPLSVMLLPPALAAMLPPPQPPVRPLGVDTKRPDGNESVKPMPVKVPAAFGFETVKLRVVVAFNAMEVAPNVMVRVGGPTTFTVAVLLVDPPPVSFEEIAPVVLA